MLDVLATQILNLSLQLLLDRLTLTQLLPQLHNLFVIFPTPTLLELFQQLFLLPSQLPHLTLQLLHPLIFLRVLFLSLLFHLLFCLLFLDFFFLCFLLFWLLFC